MEVADGFLAFWSLELNDTSLIIFYVFIFFSQLVLARLYLAVQIGPGSEYGVTAPSVAFPLPIDYLFILNSVYGAYE